MGPSGSTPPILRAIAALESVAKLVERHLNIERNRRSPVSRDELDQVKRAVITVFREFLPAERFASARLRFAQLVGLPSGQQ